MRSPDYLQAPVFEAVEEIAWAIEEIAWAIEEIAWAIEEYRQNVNPSPAI